MRICERYDQEFEKARIESDGDLEYASHHPFQVSVGAHSTKVRETSTNRAASGAEVYWHSPFAIQRERPGACLSPGVE